MTYIILCSTMLEDRDDDMADAYWTEDYEEAEGIGDSWVADVESNGQQGQYSILKLVDGGFTEVVTAV